MIVPYHRIVWLTVMSSQNPSPAPLQASFGVGCFHFGFSGRALEGENNHKQYVDDVRSFLSTYPNVEEIQVPDLEITMLKQELFEFDDRGEITCGYGITPWPGDWLLEFIIDVPERIQNEIWETLWGRPRSIEARKYRVSIHYAGELPVAFVSGIDGNLTEPSDAVVLIREYLKKYKPDGSSVEFQWIGPSPFHADFYIEESTNNEFRYDKKAGYDAVFFPIPPGEDKTEIAWFMSQLEEEITKELGLYYSLIQSRNRLNEQWGLFSDRVENILDFVAEKKPWYRTAFNMAAIPELDVLSIDLIRYEISVEQEVRRVRDEIEMLSIERGLNRFCQCLDNEINDLLRAPTEKFTRIVQVIQDHNKTMTGFRTVLIAALIGIVAAFLGGVAGGFVTLLSRN